MFGVHEKANCLRYFDGVVATFKFVQPYPGIYLAISKTGASEPGGGGGRVAQGPLTFVIGGQSPPLYMCLYFSGIMYVCSNDINQDKYLLQLWGLKNF